jgi:hypothetical protein
MQNEISEEKEISSSNEQSRQKTSSFNLFKRLRGGNKYETLENYSIGGVIFGALLMTIGIGLTALDTKGLSTIIAMMGTFFSFISSVTLVFTWLLKELFG